MDKQEKDNNMHICAGLLAHVDAGKQRLVRQCYIAVEAYET